MSSTGHTSTARRWELIALLARKEWHIRYRSAKLGYAWAVLQPLMLMVVLLIVFGYVVPIDSSPETVPYPLFLLCGLFPWHFASVALSSATPSFPNSRKLVRLAPFPRDVLPLGVVGAHLVNLILTLPLLLPLYVYYGKFPSLWLLALPVPLLLQSVIVGALSLIAALACVRFADTFFLVQALLLPWFYATPVFYPLSAAERFSPWIWLNPLTGIIPLYRKCLMPDWLSWQDADVTLCLIASVSWSIVLTAVALWLLRRVESTMADWL